MLNALYLLVSFNYSLRGKICIHFLFKTHGLKGEGWIWGKRVLTRRNVKGGKHHVMQLAMFMDGWESDVSVWLEIGVPVREKWGEPGRQKSCRVWTSFQLAEAANSILGVRVEHDLFHLLGQLHPLWENGHRLEQGWKKWDSLGSLGS